MGHYNLDLVVDPKYPSHAVPLNDALSQAVEQAPKGKSKVNIPAGTVCRPVTMAEVLHDQRYAPFTRNEYIAFLQMEHSEENIAFWMTVERFKQDNKEDRKRFENILSMFIEEGSPSEVNIPYSMRSELLDVRDHNKSFDPATVFDNTQQEVERLMESDSFKRFFSYALKNLPNRHLKWRYLAAVVNFIVAIGMVAMMCIMQGPNLVLDEETFITSRWPRVVTVIPFFMAFNFWFSARAKLCPGLALRGVQMSLPTVGYFTTYFKRKGTRVQDSYANQEIKRLSVRILVKAVVWAIIFAAIGVALPPGYEGL